MWAVWAAGAAGAVAGAPATGGLLLATAHAQDAKAYKGKEPAGRSAELRRGGYYSYGVPDGARKSNIHLAPMVDLQSPAGPFDSGFYFDSGINPHWWNNAPYPN
jgi:hypothetical protein